VHLIISKLSRQKSNIYKAMSKWKMTRDDYEGEKTKPCQLERLGFGRRRRSYFGQAHKNSEATVQDVNDSQDEDE